MHRPWSGQAVKWNWKISRRSGLPAAKHTISMMLNACNTYNTYTTCNTDNTDDIYFDTTFMWSQWTLKRSTKCEYHACKVEVKHLLRIRRRIMNSGCAVSKGLQQRDMTSACANWSLKWWHIHVCTVIKNVICAYIACTDTDLWLDSLNIFWWKNIKLDQRIDQPTHDFTL